MREGFKDLSGCKKEIIRWGIWWRQKSLFSVEVIGFAAINLIEEEREKEERERV